MFLARAHWSELCSALQMEFLESVEAFARQAHGDQQRKYEPGPYIIHLVRVKNFCLEYIKDEVIAAAALLHDVLEDTPVTKQELLEYLQTVAGDRSKKILDLVVELTDVYTKNNYPQWNRRKRKAKETERLSQTSAEAQTIKYADILDNSMTISKGAGDFAGVYLSEAKNLIRAMQKGNPALRSRVLETVDRSIETLKNEF